MGCISVGSVVVLGPHNAYGKPSKPLGNIAFPGILAGTRSTTRNFGIVQKRLAKKDCGAGFAANRSTKLIPRHAIWPRDACTCKNPDVPLATKLESLRSRTWFFTATFPATRTVFLQVHNPPPVMRSRSTERQRRMYEYVPVRN